VLFISIEFVLNCKKDLRMCLHHRICAGAVSLSLLLFAACSREKPADGKSDFLVRMGDCTVTVQDLEAEQLRLRKEGRPVPSKRELLDQMVEFKAQVMRARADGLDRDPATERSIEHLLVAAVREKREVFPDVEVSEAELKAAYEADLDRYTRPAAERLAVLSLNLESGATPSKREEVRHRMEEAKTLADAQPLNSGRGASMQGFAQLSMTHSDDQISRYRGGDIGWSNRNMPSPRVPQAVWEAGVALETGKVSEILETPDGFYLVKKTDSRPASVTPYDEVRIALRKKILAERRSGVEKDFVAACLAWAAPERDETRIAQLSDEPVLKKEVAGTPVPAMGVPHE